jgi:hypothetical protein
MTLPSSGFSLVDVIKEVFGQSYTVGKDIGQCIVASDPAVAGGAEPGSILSFASHSQKWGRVYVESQISFTAYIYSASQGYDLIIGADTLVYTGDRDSENIYVYRNTSAGNIVSGDGVRIAIYYRTKQTTNSWTLSVGWNNYATATYSPHNLTLSSWDYKFVLMNNI